METTEVEKSNGSEETPHLNRNRSFKSKQLVRSQALRETHSPPRALSPAQPPAPTPTINNGITINNNNVKSAPNVDKSAPNVANSAHNVANSAPNLANSAHNVANSAPNVTNSAHNVANSAPKVIKTNTVTVSGPNEINDDRTVSVSDDSSHVSVRSSDVNSSAVKLNDNNNDDYKKKQPVEIQITSGGWDEATHERGRARRWHSDAPRDLLSNNPRVCCVCGSCSACVHCRGRRRRHYCSHKQDSGIVCPDDCPDYSDNETGGHNNNNIRKSSSLDVDDSVYCRCPDRKERPKNIPLSRYDSDERNEPTGPELVAFIKDTLNKNVRDRMALLKIERELHALVNDTGRCIVRFPVMTSYGRMLVHRVAALFQLSHHLDHSNKTCVLVSKSGTCGGRIPCTSFKEWCTATFPPSPQRPQPEPPHAKSILKRDTHSLDEAGGGALANTRSKSLEQRERDYERVRRRIFSSQEEAQWPWLASGPIKLLTPEGGRNRLLKVQSLEGAPGGARGGWRGGRGPVSKSHSFGGYAGTEQPHAPRLLSRQGDLASSSWRLSPSSSGYKTLSLRSTDSITPSPTGGASPEPAAVAEGAVVWAVTDMAAVPPGALVIHPQTGRPLTNPDGSVYTFDPANPPVLYDTGALTDQQKLDPNNEKRRGRLEKQHSFIDNECGCGSREDCRGNCCCDCRRREHTETTTVQQASPIHVEANQQTDAQETPIQYEIKQPEITASEQVYPTNTEPYEEPTNQKPEYDQTANQRQEYEVQTNITTNQNASYEKPAKAYEQPSYEQEQVYQQYEQYEPTNHKPAEPVRYEPTNQIALNNSMQNRGVKMTNQDGLEVHYQQQYVHQGYRTDEMTSPPQLMNQFMSQEMNMQVMTQAKLTPLPLPDPNMRPMSLTNMTNMTNMVYPAMQGYPYQCRIEPSLQMYQQVMPAEEQKLTAQHTDTAFRIDPSYPYAALDYSGCGTCDTTLGQQPRSYSVPYGQLEVPQVLPPYPMPNMLLQQPPLQAYPQYTEQMQWAAVPTGAASTAGKLVVPELYPVLHYPAHYPAHYNYVYPQVGQVMPQPYRICQPVYPVLDKQDRRNSFTPRPKRNSIGSACNTPHDDKVPYDDYTRQTTQQLTTQPQYTTQQLTTQQLTTQQQYTTQQQQSHNAQTTHQSEIAVKIQQIKSEMAQLNTRERDGRIDREREKRGEYKRRNSGNGLLGNCPVNTFGVNNGRVMGRGSGEDGQLSHAARAIVNSLRNMQAKNTYQVNRRDYQGQNPRGERPAPAQEHDRQLNVPLYRQPYLLRQMSQPSTWCRRSPAPVHPVLNHPRRQHPDNRNPRR
ncbi:unnamed protein product [Chrysodeixis includens]|uniref:Uncharacterized protein n=1 Tax=Chrysodeixis includens TaxID=689277 RepID=A0A9P0C1Y7_CHRIL|nr:unnamed protein product [Chrysodeixis includens]